MSQHSTQFSNDILCYEILSRLALQDLLNWRQVNKAFFCAVSDVLFANSKYQISDALQKNADFFPSLILRYASHGIDLVEKMTRVGLACDRIDQFLNLGLFKSLVHMSVLPMSAPRDKYVINPLTGLKEANIFLPDTFASQLATPRLNSVTFTTRTKDHSPSIATYRLESLNVLPTTITSLKINVEVDNLFTFASYVNVMTRVRNDLRLTSLSLKYWDKDLLESLMQPSCLRHLHLMYSSKRVRPEHITQLNQLQTLVMEHLELEGHLDLPPLLKHFTGTRIDLSHGLTLNDTLNQLNLDSSVVGCQDVFPISAPIRIKTLSIRKTPLSMERLFTNEDFLHLQTLHIDSDSFAFMDYSQSAQIIQNQVSKSAALTDLKMTGLAFTGTFQIPSSLKHLTLDGCLLKGNIEWNNARLEDLTINVMHDSRKNAFNILKDMDMSCLQHVLVTSLIPKAIERKLVYSSTFLPRLISSGEALRTLKLENLHELPRSLLKEHSTMFRSRFAINDVTMTFTGCSVETQ